jgi:hypothetical protein
MAGQLAGELCRQVRCQAVHHFWSMDEWNLFFTLLLAVGLLSMGINKFIYMWFI